MTRFLASLVAAAILGAALMAAWQSVEPPGRVLESVDVGFLSENFGVDVSPDWSGLPTRIDRTAALAIIRDRSPSDAPRVEEIVLANVRARAIGNLEYEGRAWVVSLAIVPPFAGGPIPVEGNCLVPPASAYTLDNTFYMYLIDAESGEILRVFGGTLEPILPEPGCTVTPPR
jgi:hypothetical protein